MSLETLLEAARYVEQQENKRSRTTSITTVDRSHLNMPPHANHFQTQYHLQSHQLSDIVVERRVDDCRGDTNGLGDDNLTNNRRGHVNSNAVLANPISINASHIDLSNPINLHQNDYDAIPNHYLNNHSNSNYGQGAGSLPTDGESVQDIKKPRNGPCVIRSGTREVHNKLEKNRRAHLKECFELLKKTLPSQDEKKSSNLSILHAAIRQIQALKKKERDFEHEMEKLAREKISAQQKLVALKKDLAATWEHVDFDAILPERNNTLDMNVPKTAFGADSEMSGNLTKRTINYGATNNLSNSATSNPPQTLQQQPQVSITTTSASIHTQMTAATVVCPTPSLNLISSSGENQSTPTATQLISAPIIPDSVPEKITIAKPTINNPQQVNQPNQQPLQRTQPQQPAQLTTVLNTCLANIMPSLHGLRVVTNDSRQLLVTHAPATGDSRGPLIAVQQNGNSEHSRPVALVVHPTTTPNDNRVTLVHSGNLTAAGADNRPLALAVQSSGNDLGRPVTFMHSGNSEARSIVLATHPGPTINVTNAQARIKAGDANPANHKIVGGMALIGTNGSDLARLPGGAELNILSNGIYRSVKGQSITVQGGLTLGRAGVSLQGTNGKPGSTVVQAVPTTENITHIVGQQAPISGLTPIATPITVVSQGNQVILASAGKMITTPILKSVGQVSQIVNAQYLDTTTLMKPVVVVSNSLTNSSASLNHQTSSAVTSASQPHNV